MEALISNAYNVPENNIVGGPSWLSFDRYDIDAKTPGTTSDADIKVMLKALLAERFHLAIRRGTTPTPVRVLYLEKGATKLKASDGKEDAGCKPQFSAPGGPPMITLDCRNQTMDDLGQLLNQMGGIADKRPVIDKTGLKGGFDFKLAWTPDGAIATVGSDAVPLTEALSSELGLKITSETAPREAWLVDSVDEDPAPDPPDTAKLLPPRPLPEFDVSVIKPFDPNSQRRVMMGRGRIDANGVPLRFLISTAWGLGFPNFIDIANPPAWLDKDLWSIDAKVSADQPGANGNRPQQLDYPQFQLMIRALLAERFHLQAHIEEREGDAYDLVAVNPKLTPVDPSIPPNDPRLRETCAAVPGPDGVDPRKKNPALDRLLYCQNTTTEHMAELMEGPVGDVHLRVFDKTGLKGRYNYTISFSSMSDMLGNGISLPGAPGTPPAQPSASEPTGAVSKSEAIRTELGLKLVKAKELVPVLVIDHIEQQPTPN
jgi:uncharacterized protein (TIGR03435 family)